MQENKDSSDLNNQKDISMEQEQEQEIERILQSEINDNDYQFTDKGFDPESANRQ